jgi:hypothetical protein
MRKASRGGHRGHGGIRMGGGTESSRWCTSRLQGRERHVRLMVPAQKPRVSPQCHRQFHSATPELLTPELLLRKRTVLLSASRRRPWSIRHIHIDDGSRTEVTLVTPPVPLSKSPSVASVTLCDAFNRSASSRTEATRVTRAPPTLSFCNS